MLINAPRGIVAHIRKLARDEAGSVISAELAVIVTVTITTLTVGLTVLANATAQEFGDIANAITLNQSYSYNGLNAVGQATCSGRTFNDSDPFWEVPEIDPVGTTEPPVIVIPPGQETPADPVTPDPGLDDPGGLLPPAANSFVPATVDEVQSVNNASANAAKLQQLQQMERELAAFQNRVQSLRQQCEADRR